MATCDPQTLLNDGSCFLCLSEKELNVAVAQLLCDIASGGAPCFPENLAGADSPLNSVTPDFIGQVYVQDDGTIWQAGSLLNSSWTVICTPGGGGNGLVWGPDPTTLQFIDSNFNMSDSTTELTFNGLVTVTEAVEMDLGDLLSLSFPDLVTIGTYFAGSYDSLTNLSMPKLASVDAGDFNPSFAVLTTMSLPAFTTLADGSFEPDCPILTDLLMPAFTTISDGGSFDPELDNLTTLDLSALQSVDGNFAPIFPSLTILSLPALVTVVGNFTPDCSSLTTLSVPVLDSIGVDFNISTCSSLAAFSANALVSIGGGVNANGCTSLITFSAQSLVDLTGGDSNLTNMPALQTLSLPSLTASHEIDCDSASLTSLVLTNLVTITLLNFSACSALPSVDLGALVTATGGVSFSGCTSLISVLVPSFVPTDGTTINFNNCALNATSVELILRRCVLAGVTTCTIDLSGGTSAGTASLNAQGQADVATLGAQLTINP